MYSKHLNFIFIIFALLISSCDKTETTNDFPSIKLGRGLPKVRTQVSDFATSVELIKLETVDKSLIDYFSYPIHIDEDYIIYYSEKNVIVFDGNGQFLRKINHKGEGPKEYTKISSYYFDIDKQHIYIVDLDKIQVYTLEGDYVKTLKTSFNAGGLYINGPNEFFVPYQQVYNQSDRDMLSVVDSTFKTINNFKSRNLTPALDVRQMLFYAGSPYQANGKVYYKEPFNDTIYQVLVHEIVPAWKIDLQGDGFTTSEGITPWEPTLKKMKIPEIGIRETSRYIFFRYYNMNQRFYSIYDKKNKSTIFHNEVLYESELSKLGVPLDMGSSGLDTFWPDYVNRNNTLVQIIRPEELSDEQLKAIGVSEDDNPILLIAKAK